VCEDWYAQLRSSLAWCAAVAEDPAALLYHTSATLAATARAAKAAGNDVDEAWRHATQLERQIAGVAAVLCNDCAHAASLVGLGVWARRVLGDTCLANDPVALAAWMPWLPAAVLDAQGKQERAAREYRLAIAPSNTVNASSERSNGSGGSSGGAGATLQQSATPEVVDFVIGRIFECYTDLADWAELDRCLTELKQVKSPAVTHAIGKHDVQLRRAAELAKFDGAAFGVGSPLAASAHDPLEPRASGPSLSIRRRLQLSELCAAEAVVRADLSDEHRHNLLIEERDLLVHAVEGLAGGAPPTSLTRSVVLQLQSLTALATVGSRDTAGAATSGNLNDDSVSAGGRVGCAFLVASKA